MEKDSEINENSSLAEVLQIPGADEVLHKYSLPCMGCPLIGFEIGMLKLGEVCRTYGIDEKKVISEIRNLKKK
ncbi:MAG: hypothetical protein QXW00_00625 [Candidatus Woesearchaeota archaeon]